MRPVRAAKRSSKHLAVLAVLAVFAGEDSILWCPFMSAMVRIDSLCLFSALPLHWNWVTNFSMFSDSDYCDSYFFDTLILSLIFMFSIFCVFDCQHLESICGLTDWACFIGLLFYILYKRDGNDYEHWAWCISLFYYFIIFLFFFASLHVLLLLHVTSPSFVCFSAFDFWSPVTIYVFQSQHCYWFIATIIIRE